MSVAEISADVRARTRSAVEVVTEHLARIEKDTLGCFYRLDPSALEQARAVDERVARGDDLPLAGVPVALKDLFVTRGVETTAGSKILGGWIPPYDGTAVRKLREAGAVLVGKLSMDEFAMGSSNENSAYGNVKNPWDPTRVPGGSSGGSAAAVAADLVAAALGTDTGGSIRQPAALTGTSGLKPTYGRVSRYGVVAFASSLDQVGPLGRSAEDCAAVLEAIAGVDDRDATSIDAPVPRYRDACQRPIRGLRIGFVSAWAEKVVPEVMSSVTAAVDALAKEGAEIVPLEAGLVDEALAAYYIIATAEASSNLARYDGVRYGLREGGDNLAEMYSRTRAAGFGAEAKRRIMLGTYVLRSGYYDAYYLRAQKVRTLIRRRYQEAFSKCDVIAGPTSPTTAFRIGEKSSDPLAMYLSDVFTIPTNMAGLPGMSIPCRFVGGLPVGLHLEAAWLKEESLLQCAAAYQRLSDWHTRRPA